MKQAHMKKIAATIACLTMILPYPVFAEESQPVELDPRGGAVVPQTETSASDQNPLLGVVPEGQGLAARLWQDPSPLRLPDDASGEIPQTLTEEESAAVLIRVDELIKMTLDSLEAQNKNFQERSGEAYNALNGEIQKYKTALSALDDFLNKSEKTENKMTAAEMLKHIGDLLSQGLSDPQDVESSSRLSSGGWIERFASYAAMNVRKVRERMTEDASLPEAKIFSAEETPSPRREEKAVFLDGSNGLVRENYQVLSAVVLGRELAKTHQLLNPPQKLHPFLRWLFYGRHLTQVRAERYLAARAKVREICMRAKAGGGLIRYKGKIMGMFLPLPGDESGGTFELVRRM